MDFTMLRQMARRCRLLAYLHNSEFTDPVLKAFADILDVKDTTKPKEPKELDDFAVADYLSKVPKMSAKEYKAILAYLNSSGETSLSWLSYPDQEYQAIVLPPNAKRQTPQGVPREPTDIQLSFLAQFKQPDSVLQASY